MDGSKQNKSLVKFWIIAISVVVVPMVAIFVYKHSMILEFDRRVEALKEQGYPTSLDDLDKTYVLPEGVVNAADVYLEAFDNYQRPTVDIENLLPVSGNYIWPDDVPPFPDDVLNALKSHLENNQTTLELLDEASKVGHCLWPRTLIIGYYRTDNLSAIKMRAMLLCERNLYLAQIGETDKLFDSITTLINFSQKSSTQPFLIDHLVKIAIKALCAKVDTPYN